MFCMDIADTNRGEAVIVILMDVVLTVAQEIPAKPET